MVAVSVVVSTTDPGPGLLGLVRSVDAQTLPAAEFELVVVDASTDGSAERLRDLAGRRPNVVVVPAAPESSAAERLAIARERASGEHLLELAQDRRLTPRALEVLLATARASGAEVVVGRVAGGAGSGSRQLPDDADRIDRGGIAPAGSVTLVRRDGDPDTAAVAAVARYACAIGAGDPPAPAGAPALDAVEVGWEADRLLVDATVQPVPPALRAWLVVAAADADIALPATVAPDGAVVASLDARTAEAGHPLGTGVWELRLRLAWADGEATLPLPAVPTAAAILDGRPFVVRHGEQGVQLDVGGSRGGVAGPAPASTASVVESAAGALLTLDQPAIHVHGDAELGARLLLDGFALRARVVCRDGAAQVEALVSSLAGVSTIGLVIGGGPAVQTGLRLRTDGVGAMTVEAVPAPPRPAPPGPPPLVQRVRRRTPPALEPVVHRLARVPALRRAYRVLLSR